MDKQTAAADEIGSDLETAKANEFDKRRLTLVDAYLRPLFSEFLVTQVRKNAPKHKPIDDQDLVVFAPHQDDETLGCGGLIATKCQLGASVTVVFLTDGAGSHPGHPSLPVKKLIQLRKNEALTALKILGVNDKNVFFFDSPDGGLGKLNPRDRTQLVQKMANVLQEKKPGSIALPFRGDYHDDHKATYGLVLEALGLTTSKPNLWEYPIYALWNLRMHHLRQPFVRQLQKIDITRVLPRKRQAVEAYHTQIRPTPPWRNRRYLLPAGLLRIFRAPSELFVISKPNDQTPDPTIR